MVGKFESSTAPYQEARVFVEKGALSYANSIVRVTPLCVTECNAETPSANVLRSREVFTSITQATASGETIEKSSLTKVVRVRVGLVYQHDVALLRRTALARVDESCTKLKPVWKHAPQNGAKRLFVIRTY